MTRAEWSHISSSLGASGFSFHPIAFEMHGAFSRLARYEAAAEPAAAADSLALAAEPQAVR